MDEGEKYEVTQDVRGQLKFLNDLEKIERKRHDEAERELLFRAAKSRTKTEDPEKEKLKAKAKELQRLEEEQLRHEKANNTARLAIGGPRKRLKLDGSEFSSSSSNAVGSSGMIGIGGSLGFSGSAGLGNRPRTKRVHLRDLMFLMEQEKELKRSPLLWKSYSS
jgi:transcription initiation factor TFIID subunit 4